MREASRCNSWAGFEFEDHLSKLYLMPVETLGQCEDEMGTLYITVSYGTCCRAEGRSHGHLSARVLHHRACYCFLHDRLLYAASLSTLQIDLAFNTKFDVIIMDSDGAVSTVEKTMQDFIALFISTGGPANPCDALRCT